jgi:hypothetical protein
VIKIIGLDPDEWYLRQAAFRALQGAPVTLPPEDGPSNVHSIALARTNRAIAQMRRGRVPPERPL